MIFEQVVTPDRLQILIEQMSETYLAKANDIVFRANNEVHRLMLYQNMTRPQAVSFVVQAIQTGNIDFLRAGLTSANRYINTQSNQVPRLPMVWIAQESEDADKWQWIRNAKESCPDCLMMDEYTKNGKTLDEIEAKGVGLPSEGETLCNISCRCVLTPI